MEGGVPGAGYQEHLLAPFVCVRTWPPPSTTTVSLVWLNVSVLPTDSRPHS